MTPATIRALADVLQNAAPENSLIQRELFERIREARSAFDGPLDPETNRQLEAAGMLVAYLARMGALAGTDVRTIAVRLLRAAADTEEAATTGGHASQATAQRSDFPPSSADGEQPPSRTASEVVSDMMLGQILLQRGHILEEHIHQALKVQRATALRMGDILVKIGACPRPAVIEALQHQASLRRLRGSLTPELPDIDHPETRGTGLKLVGEVLLGEILVERGVITRRQLERALEVQKSTGARVGEALVKLGATTMGQIENALRLQGKDRRFRGSESDTRTK